METTSLKTNILEEIKDLLVEGEFNARDMLIQTYYKVGKLIIDNDLIPMYVANYIGRSERQVEYMVKFANDPKILDKLEKNESWTSIIRTRLTTPKEELEHECEPLTICSICHKRLSVN